MSETQEPTADKRARATQQKKDLERQEERSLGGLSPRTQKQQLIDTRRLADKFPERHFRYARLDRVESLEDLGYAQVSEAEAKAAKVSVKRADLVLMACPKAEWKERRTYVEHENRRRLGATRGQFKAEVASEERALRAQGALEPGRSLLVDDAD